MIIFALHYATRGHSIVCPDSERVVQQRDVREIERAIFQAFEFA
jgi:hypothetical protein